MNLNAWIFLGIITLVFAAAIAYGNYYTWYARKNPEYFRLSMMEKDILRLKKSTRKSQSFDSSAMKILKPFVISMAVSCIVFAILGKNTRTDGSAFTLFQFSLMSFFCFCTFLFIYLIISNFSIRPDSITYSNAFMKKKFNWKLKLRTRNLAEILEPAQPEFSRSEIDHLLI
jgi:hypothetical protein